MVQMPAVFQPHDEIKDPRHPAQGSSSSPEWKIIGIVEFQLMNNLLRAVRQPTDCAEEKEGLRLGRKAGGFPQSGAAEPR